MSISRRSLATVLLTPALLPASQTVVTDAEWALFMTWFRSEAGAASGGIITQIAAYKSKLIADGSTPSQAQQVVDRLQARMIGDPEWMGMNFDRLYSRENIPHRGVPNAFLVEVVEGVKPGKALDIGMGEGSNAVYLATKGWDVTGLDLSNVGVAHAKEQARKAGVNIDVRVQDIRKFEIGERRWDLICLLYFVIDAPLMDLYERIPKALRPGGLVIAEGFGGMGRVGAMLDAWKRWEPSGLELLRMEHREGTSGWGGNRVNRLLLKNSG